MRKQLIGCAVFLTVFLFGTAAANLMSRADATALPKPPVATVEKTAIEKAAEEVEIKEIDEPVRMRNGWYALDRFKGMNEVTLVSIYHEDGNEEDSGGGVFTTFEKYGDQGHFSSTWIKIDGNHVVFETEKLHGISYKFEGTFRSDDWGREGKKPLYGTLKKFVKGKLVAETTGNLEYFEPHCWH